MPVWLTMLLSLALLVVFTLPAWWPEGKHKEDNDDERRGDTDKRS